MVKATDVLAKAVTTAGSPAGESTNLVIQAEVAALQPMPMQTSEPVPLPVPEGGWPADEYTGKGGDYVRDPFTGIRSPAVPAA